MSFITLVINVNLKHVFVSVKPLEVRILHKLSSVSAGTSYRLTCETTGSKPRPVVSWWLGSKKMQNITEKISADRNVTTSTLTFTPVSEDNGKYLSCRAENPAIPVSGIEDGWRINVHCELHFVYYTVMYV